MQRHDEGSFSRNGVRYSYLAFDPFKKEGPFYQEFSHLMVGYFSFSEKEILANNSSFIIHSSWFQWLLSLVVLFVAWALNLLNYFRIQNKESLEVSSLVSDYSHDGVLITDSMRRAVYCNRTLSLISGFSEIEVYQQSLRVFDLNGETFNLLPKLDAWQGFVWIEGKLHTALAHVMLNINSKANGLRPRSVALFSDPRNLARESYKDLLLANSAKSTLFDAYPLQLLQQKRFYRQTFFVVYLKIENLDLVESHYSLNEHYELGMEVRKRLFAVIGSGSLIIQYCPDTFLLTVDSSPKKLKNYLEALLTHLQAPLKLGQEQQQLRIAMGVSDYSLSCSSAKGMLQQSRIALAGLNHYQKQGWLQYSEAVDQKLARYYAIVDAFEEALHSNSIEVYFQPVIDIQSNTIVEAEALVRWTHPELGPLSPNEFIPIVEEHKLERKLSSYVIEQVCRYIAELKRKELPDISFSINLCPTELQDPYLVPHMIKTMDRFNVEHNRLVIELTERSLLSDIESANKTLDLLHKNHVRVAIDDFGTGFSSLKYLHELHVDLIKIDRSFIENYPDLDTGIILRAMVGMTKELNIPVLVEGVEKEEQLQFIKELGVTFYQGFLFSKAVDGETFMQLLE
ncbi:MAG: EAL domain-containing protein [Sphaerochaetaceae bacterium]